MRSPAAAASSQAAHRSHTPESLFLLSLKSEHFTANIEVASQLRDKVLEVPCGATRRVSRTFRRRPHRRISATKGAGSGTLYRHFECGRKARGFLASRWRRSRQLGAIDPRQRAIRGIHRGIARPQGRAGGQPVGPGGSRATGGVAHTLYSAPVRTGTMHAISPIHNKPWIGDRQFRRLTE